MGAESDVMTFFVDHIKGIIKQEKVNLIDAKGFNWLLLGWVDFFFGFGCIVVVLCAGRKELKLKSQQI